MGYRQYELVREDDEPALRAVLASGLGVLRQDSLAARSLTAGPDNGAQALSPDLLVLTQASAQSSVHRSVYPYYVGVKTFDDEGNVTGEHRFLGIFSTTALHENVLDIPVIERRVREVIHRAGFPLQSYSGQRMLEVIQTYPRTELFSVDADTLYQTTTGVIALAERRRLRLFLRRDPFGRFFSCLVYLPRDRYTTTSRLAMQEVLLAELGGLNLEYSARIGESALARVHFMVHTDPARTPRAGHRTRSRTCWPRPCAAGTTASSRRVVGDDGGRCRVGHRAGAAVRRGVPGGLQGGLPRRPRALWTTGASRRSPRATSTWSFYVPEDAEPGERRFKLFVTGDGITLSDVLPMLQRMGVIVVDERPYEIAREDGVQCWIYDFGLRIDQASLDQLSESDLESVRERFQNAFAAVWRGEAEVDRFNSLVLRAGLTWQQAVMLRAYAKYLRQAGTPYRQYYIEDAVLATRRGDRTGRVVRGAVRPGLDDPTRAAAPDAGQRDRQADRRRDQPRRGPHPAQPAHADQRHAAHELLLPRRRRQRRPYLSMKLDPQAIPDLPKPRPKFEIFVYSPRSRACTCGSARRARWPALVGPARGLPHRDPRPGQGAGREERGDRAGRREGRLRGQEADAPAGDPGIDRENFMSEGIACYRMFISGLLDLTDNLINNEVVPAPQVVRHDGDDTYLVVAADKGTATFSDIANGVSQSYGFWLGDAFASGGSVGYDHKAMGITAKGAWESVKRTFRELGVDTQTEEFTVVGIGDMSGDVFGNGMMLSEHIRLVAAFDHRHIFIDPNPDAARSFAERVRLFDVPRSSWDDYDRSLISEGGGICPLTAKSIPITEQVRVALGLPEGVAKLSPPELMKAILLAPVDLLWNGGIGTYVKASTESHAEVGDKANDVDPRRRRRAAREGRRRGRQPGSDPARPDRVRAHGGKVNTDALDNSAGVDCSDHEVNIKILLDQLVREGRLEQLQRNDVLGEMTDEVGDLVLADNYSQNNVLGVSRAHAGPMLSVHARLTADLESRGALNRKLEALPSAAEFKALEKQGEGLTSPELSTLLAFTKLTLKEDLLASDLPTIDTFTRSSRTTSRACCASVSVPRSNHPLAGDHHDVVVNEVIDGGGITYAFRLAEEMSASATDAVRAYAVVTEVFDLPAIWREIQAPDIVVPTDVQDDMVLESRRLLDRASRWLLSNRPQPLAVGSRSTASARGRRALAVRPGVVAGQGGRTVSRARPTGSSNRAFPRSSPARWRHCSTCTACSTSPRSPSSPNASSARRVAGPGAFAPRVGGPVLRAVGPPRHRPHARLGDEPGAGQPLARAGPPGTARRLLLVVARDHPRCAQGQRPRRHGGEKIAKWEQANASRLARSRGALDEINRVHQLDLATLSVAARQVRSMVR